MSESTMTRRTLGTRLILLTGVLPCGLLTHSVIHKHRNDYVVSHIVIVCPSVWLGLTMVKFSYSLVWHHEMAVYVVK